MKTIVFTVVKIVWAFCSLVNRCYSNLNALCQVVSFQGPGVYLKNMVVRVNFIIEKCDFSHKITFFLLKWVVDR
tara:strand:+ start:400 stop:621 length:222 start_codon:yes stop_codon:yes gene_type:complete